MSMACTLRKRRGASDAAPEPAAPAVATRTTGRGPSEVVFRSLPIASSMAMPSPSRNLGSEPLFSVGTPPVPDRLHFSGFHVDPRN